MLYKSVKIFYLKQDDKNYIYGFHDVVFCMIMIILTMILLTLLNGFIFITNKIHQKETELLGNFNIEYHKVNQFKIIKHL